MPTKVMNWDLFILDILCSFLSVSPICNFNCTAISLSSCDKPVTILISGGEVSRKDIDLSLVNGRPVIALSRTGHVADELARDPNRDKLITVVPADAEQRILEIVQDALSVKERSMSDQLFKGQPHQTLEVVE